MVVDAFYRFFYSARFVVPLLAFKELERTKMKYIVHELNCKLSLRPFELPSARGSILKWRAPMHDTVHVPASCGVDEGVKTVKALASRCNVLLQRCIPNLSVSHHYLVLLQDK